MDTLSHTLWGGGLFGNRRKFGIAMFFGAFPDVISFGLWLPVNLASNGFKIGRPSLDVIPQWVMVNYNVSHSLIVAFATITLVALWRKDIAFAILAWPFHILLDIPFHTAEFFPTIIFWPVSDVIFDGIEWHNPWVWYTNITCLVALYFWRWKTGYFKNSQK